MHLAELGTKAKGLLAMLAVSNGLARRMRVFQPPSEYGGFGGGVRRQILTFDSALIRVCPTARSRMSAPNLHPPRLESVTGPGDVQGTETSAIGEQVLQPVTLRLRKYRDIHSLLNLGLWMRWPTREGKKITPRLGNRCCSPLSSPSRTR